MIIGVINYTKKKLLDRQNEELYIEKREKIVNI